MEFSPRTASRMQPMDDRMPTPVARRPVVQEKAYDLWSLGPRPHDDNAVQESAPAWTRKAPTEVLRETARDLADVLLEGEPLGHEAWDSAGRETLAQAIGSMDPDGTSTWMQADTYLPAEKPAFGRVARPDVQDLDAFWRPTPTTRGAALTEAASADADVKSTSTMVALYPDPDVAQALAIDGGEDVDQLHVTLAFLGDVQEDRLHAITDAVERAVRGQDLDGLSGEIAGGGTFTAGPKPVQIALVDCPHLPDLRQAIVGALDRVSPARKDHGYTPHITLKYGAGAAPKLDATPLRFDHVRVVRGDEEIARIPIQPRDAGLREAGSIAAAAGTQVGSGVSAKREDPKAKAERERRNKVRQQSFYTRVDPRSGKTVTVKKQAKPAVITKRNADGTYEYKDAAGNTHKGRTTARVAKRWAELGIVGEAKTKQQQMVRGGKGTPHEYNQTTSKPTDKKNRKASKDKVKADGSSDEAKAAGAKVAPGKLSGGNVEQGARNDPRAKKVQQWLADAGIRSEKADGTVGPITVGQIKRFQKANGLLVDGKVGKQTWAALKAVKKPAKSGRPAAMREAGITVAASHLARLR